MGVIHLKGLKVETRISPFYRLKQVRKKVSGEIPSSPEDEENIGEIPLLGHCLSFTPHAFFALHDPLKSPMQMWRIRDVRSTVPYIPLQSRKQTESSSSLLPSSVQLFLAASSSGRFA
jgi:hypothetical protein